jgi:hypothetical protein
MKVTTTINGTIKIELQPETSDDKHILEMIKNKQVSKLSLNCKGDGELSGVVFEMGNQ